jgi:hypothetical protein
MLFSGRFMPAARRLRAALAGDFFQETKLTFLILWSILSE